MGNVSSIICCIGNNKQGEAYAQSNYDEESKIEVKRQNLKSPIINRDEEKTDIQISQQSIDNEEQAQQEKQGGQETTVSDPYHVEDHLSDYEFDGDSDAEIDDLATHRNQWEEDVTFSKKGLIKEIDGIFDLEKSEEEKKLWELKLDKDEVKIYIKKNGSKHAKDHPYVKAQVVFNSAYSLHKVAETIFSEKHRLKWDKNVCKYEVTKLGHKNSQLTYQVNKGVLNMNNRDFLDKQIKFSADNKLYVYYSSVPNDLLVRETPNKTDRATTLVGVQRFHRRQSDGKIVYEMLMQCDLKMKITPKLIAMFLPSGLQDWSRKINKYINDNYEKI